MIHKPLESFSDSVAHADSLCSRDQLSKNNYSSSQRLEVYIFLFKKVVLEISFSATMYEGGNSPCAYVSSTDAQLLLQRFEVYNLFFFVNLK